MRLTFSPAAEVVDAHERARQKARLLVGASGVVVAAHAVELFYEGRPNWSALAVRLVWAALLLSNAAVVRRCQWPTVRVSAAVSVVAMALLYLALLETTGRSRSPLFSFAFVLVIVMPIFLGEFYRVALVASATLIVGAWAMLVRDGVSVGDQVGWGHAGAAAFVVAALLVAAELRARRAAEALSRSREETLQRLAESQLFAAVGRLAAEVAHEVNNPLSSAKSSANFIRANATAAGGEVAAACSDLVASLDRVAQSVRRLAQKSHEPAGTRDMPGDASRSGATEAVGGAPRSGVARSVTGEDALHGGGPPGRSSVPLTLTWIGAAAAIAWTIATSGHEAETTLGYASKIVILAVPGLAAVVAAQQVAGRARLGWRLVGVAWLVSAAAACAWLVSTLWGGPTGFAGVSASWLYDAYYPFAVAGLWCLVKPPAGARVKLLVDAVIVVVATQVLAWYFMLRYYAPGELLSHWRSILANQLGETLVLLAAAVLLQGGRPGRVVALRILGLAAFLATLADLMSAGSSLSPSHVQTVLSEVALTASAALAATAALLPTTDGRRRGLAVELVVRMMAQFPYMAILVVSGILIGELPMIGRIGTPVPVLAVAVTLLTFLAILRLAVAQREAEGEAAARAAQEERLRQGQKLEALGRLASSVAHDFANLLAGLQGCASDLRRRLADAPEVAEIERTVKRGGELCRGLLGFARNAPLREAVDLRQLVDGVAPLLRRLLPLGLDLKVEGPYGIARAVADPGQVEVALVNLVVNARDAMPRGGTIELVVDAPELPGSRGPDDRQVRPLRWARIEVRDSGQGMEAATLARCCEPFFTTKPPGLGTGLGLSTVTDIVEAAGGRLLVDSAPGRGTRVSMLMRPVGDVPAAGPSAGLPPT